mmetsp:Transcript_19013/g.40276  ORF Transcript_19013/g.40276 Transcript_19013/m.40276 type:complete len:302 (-) Transcript_19013:510-1415(-)
MVRFEEALEIVVRASQVQTIHTLLQVKDQAKLQGAPQSAQEERSLRTRRVRKFQLWHIRNELDRVERRKRHGPAARPRRPFRQKAVWRSGVRCDHDHAAHVSNGLHRAGGEGSTIPDFAVAHLAMLIEMDQRVEVKAEVVFEQLLELAAYVLENDLAIGWVAEPFGVGRELIRALAVRLFKDRLYAVVHEPSALCFGNVLSCGQLLVTEPEISVVVVRKCDGNVVSEAVWPILSPAPSIKGREDRLCLTASRWGRQVSNDAPIQSAPLAVTSNLVNHDAHVGFACPVLQIVQSEPVIPTFD